MAYHVEVTREAQTEVTETFVWKGEHQSFEKASEWYNGISLRQLMAEAGAWKGQQVE